VYRQEEKFADRDSIADVAPLLGKNYGVGKGLSIVHAKKNMGTFRTWQTNILQVQTI
jgi:hypothetical protein